VEVEQKVLRVTCPGVPTRSLPAPGIGSAGMATAAFAGDVGAVGAFPWTHSGSSIVSCTPLREGSALEGMALAGIGRSYPGRTA